MVSRSHPGCFGMGRRGHVHRGADGSRNFNRIRHSRFSRSAGRVDTGSEGRTPVQHSPLHGGSRRQKAVVARPSPPSRLAGSTKRWPPALVALEQRGSLRALVTQNIDGLHQIAGHAPGKVIEVHGTMRDVMCMACGWRGPAGPVLDRVRAGEADPRAGVRWNPQERHDLVRPGAGARGDRVGAAGGPETPTSCSPIGTSLQVYPVADLVPLAKSAGARVIIVNAEPTPFDHLADAVIHERDRRGASRDLRRPPPNNRRRCLEFQLMAGWECYHCKQWIEEGEPHDCWTTTEAALTAGLSEDLRDAWERLRETAVEFGEQRIYASHDSIMFSRKACYFFVRPKRQLSRGLLLSGTHAQGVAGPASDAGIENEDRASDSRSAPRRGRTANDRLAAGGVQLRGLAPRRSHRPSRRTGRPHDGQQRKKRRRPARRPKRGRLTSLRNRLGGVT